MDLGAVTEATSQAETAHTTKKKAPGSAEKTVVVPVNALEDTVVERAERKILDQISLEFNSPLHITPPGSPRFTHPSHFLLQLEEKTPPTDTVDSDVTMQLVRSRGKRHRVEPFQQMVSKERPRVLPGLATSNYFSVLASMEVELEEVEVAANPVHGKRIQIVPVKTRMPQKVATSKEAAHFFHKRHTAVTKAERPTTVGEVGELMELDSKNSSQSL